jgi:hypothetical protein
VTALRDRRVCLTYIDRSTMMHVHFLAAFLAAALLVDGTTAFAPAVTTRPLLLSFHHHRMPVAPLQAAASALPNPFKKLPWNVRKEKEREMRRLKQERAKLHRELGIPEDATYEDIVEATNSLLVKAGGDIKKKIQVEVAKDKILQIRLNERLAGLAAQSKDARAQSRAEEAG